MIDFEFEFQYAEEKQPTLQKVGGSIPAGRCVVLCGGSGCGKSTLLRCINGLIPQFYEGKLKGFCHLNGQDTAGISIGEIGELAASVFQDPRSQFFTVNSSNEVAFGLENLGLPQSPGNHGKDRFPSSSSSVTLSFCTRSRSRVRRRQGCTAAQNLSRRPLRSWCSPDGTARE